MDPGCGEKRHLSAHHGLAYALCRDHHDTFSAFQQVRDNPVVRFVNVFFYEVGPLDKTPCWSCLSLGTKFAENHVGASDFR